DRRAVLPQARERNCLLRETPSGAEPEYRHLWKNPQAPGHKPRGFRTIDSFRGSLQNPDKTGCRFLNAAAHFGSAFESSDLTLRMDEARVAAVGAKRRLNRRSRHWRRSQVQWTELRLL